MRSISQVTAVFLCVSLLAAGLPPAPTAAFSVSVHKRVTTDALSGLGLSSTALNELANQSIHPDFFHMLESGGHFGNCAWAEGVGWVATYRALAVTAAYNYHQTGDATFRALVYEYLGHVFHATEDFYAHSNWVEGHAPGELATLEGAQPAGWSSGTSVNAWPKRCAPGMPSHREMNKDDTSRPGYQEAYEDARMAVKAQWTLFELAIKATYGTETGERVIAKLKT